MGTRARRAQRAPGRTVGVTEGEHPAKAAAGCSHGSATRPLPALGGFVTAERHGTATPWGGLSFGVFGGLPCGGHDVSRAAVAGHCRSDLPAGRARISSA